MSFVKRSSHPSKSERAAIDYDRKVNYASGLYQVAKDGSLRDGQGKFVRGTKTTGGFDYHPEHRRKGGGWNKHMTVSYQYRRYWNMEKQEFIALGKRYRVISTSDKEKEQYPYEKHTLVEEITFRTVLKSLYSLTCAKAVILRVEGYPSRMTIAR